MMKAKLKIIAIVKSGEQTYYVLNRPIQYSYTKIDRETIIGEDEGALCFYKRDDIVMPFGKTAFGGRKFTLQLTDGTIEECCGQWWDDMSKSANELFPFDSICDFFHATKDELKEYYLFYGGMCEKRWLEKLVAEYRGATYEYWEYKNMIKSNSQSPAERRAV